MIVIMGSIMKSDAFNYASEFERLRELEFGEPFEPGIRLSAIALAGVLIFLSTGWISALIWAGYFLLSFWAHAHFITSRKSFVARYEVVVAALLFFNLQVAYCWLPTLMFCGNRDAIAMVGGVLIAAQLLFLVRRADTLLIYQNVQIVAVVGMGVMVYFSFLPNYTTPLEFAGVALALIGLIYYFYQSLRVSRRMWLSREASALQAHQAQKMAAIGQLAGGVAHDFNNNLTAIIGSLELIQLSDDPREQKVDLENALIAGRQAATTVKQLLIFARMQKPNMSKVDLEHAFSELKTLTSRLIPASVAFEIDVFDPELEVLADRGQLLSGLINLIVNSVDAMPQGGVLKLSAKQKQITAPSPMTDGSKLAPGGYAEITVSDTGHGIPPDIMSNVIDPFFTTKPVGKGTGLGLSMVAGMLREFGGGLSVQSDPGGTSIGLFLPIFQSSADGRKDI